VSHPSRISSPTPARAWLRRTAVAAAVAIGVFATAGLAQATPLPATGTPTPGHGLMPTRTATGGSASNGELRNASGPAGTAAANTASLLAYQGGVAGTGVVTGMPKVYLVFWGSQWGTQGTTPLLSGSRYATFTGDPAGMAPVLQQFYAGLGTNGETWSGIATTYCQSSAVATVRIGATSCPAGATHIAYPAGGALAGVWEDSQTSAPASASQPELAAEAERAAAHFNRAGVSSGVQFVVVSPHGTTPGGFNTPSGAFCAWHDFTTGPNGVTSDASSVLFTNLPYIPDAGYSCGANYVNPGSLGTLDGVSVIASHEYVETLTDPYVGYGWYNAGYGESADVCAWAPVSAGGAGNLDTARGTFPVSGVWDNAAQQGSGGCVLSHAVVTSHTITIANPGTQTGTLATPVNPITVHADDAIATTGGGITPSAQPTLHFQAFGLPAGLAINPDSGVISGAPRAAAPARVTIIVTDSLGGYGVIHFTWTVRNPIGISHVAPVQSRRGAQVRIRVHAGDSRGHRVTYAATGLPTGTAINPATGLIAGRVTGRRGTYRVTVRVSGSGGARASIRFTWAVQ
jgi:hypothetical protein